jgi:hypothetical protein
VLLRGMGRVRRDAAAWNGYKKSAASLGSCGRGRQLGLYVAPDLPRAHLPGGGDPAWVRTCVRAHAHTPASWGRDMDGYNAMALDPRVGR